MDVRRHDDMGRAAGGDSMKSEISRLEYAQNVLETFLGSNMTAQSVGRDIAIVIESLRKNSPPSFDAFSKVVREWLEEDGRREYLAGESEEVQTDIPPLPEKMWVTVIGDIHAHNGRIIEDLVFNSYIDANKFAESRLHYYGNNFVPNIELTDRIDQVEIAWSMEAAGVSVWVQRLDLK